MSVHWDATRERYVVRWREDGRNRIRRFRSEPEAETFAEELGRAPAVPDSGGLAAMEQRLAQLEARLGGAAADDTRVAGGVYCYTTKDGRRWYFKYRNADGSSSSKRGFTSRRAAAQAKAALEEGVRRGEVKASRETFAEYWSRFSPLSARTSPVARSSITRATDACASCRYSGSAS